MPLYALKHISSRDARFVTETTNVRLKIFRYATHVSFPRSITADEAVLATTGDVSEEAKTTDRLAMVRRWRWIAA